MRVSVIINPRAGSVNPNLIREKVSRALFRCELNFCTPQSLEEMSSFLNEEMDLQTDYFLICGGDGTINTCLQTFLKRDEDLSKLPPLAVIRSGTANDLAHEIGISYKVDQAARNILEGTIKNIDIIEITSGGDKAYMITNGGVGLPAVTADLANQLRSKLQKVANCPKTANLFKTVARNAHSAIKKMGPGVYSMMALEAIRSWRQEGWELEIEMAGQKSFSTKAPIVLVNNQPGIGKKFLPAPYTSNTDGFVNLLLSEVSKTTQLVSSLTHLAKGTVEKSKNFRSFELKEFTLRSKNPQRPLTFFGDGEILFKDVTEVSVKCLHKGLPVVVDSCRN